MARAGRVTWNPTNHVYNFEAMRYEDTPLVRGATRKTRREDPRWVRSLARRTYKSFMEPYDMLVFDVKNDTQWFVTPFASYKDCPGCSGEFCRGSARVNVAALRDLSIIQNFRKKRLDGTESVCADCAQEGLGAANDWQGQIFGVCVSICALCGDVCAHEPNTADKRFVQTNMDGPDFVVHADCWLRVDALIDQCVKEEGTEATNGLICDSVALKLIDEKPPLVGYSRPLPILSTFHAARVQEYINNIPADTPVNVACTLVRLPAYSSVPKTHLERMYLWNANDIAFMATKQMSDRIPCIPAGDLYIIPDFFLRTGSWEASMLAARRIEVGASRFCPSVGSMMSTINAVTAARPLVKVIIVFDTIADAGPVDALFEFTIQFAHRDRVFFLFKNLDTTKPRQRKRPPKPVRVNAGDLAENLIRTYPLDNSATGRLLRGIAVYKQMLQDGQAFYRSGGFAAIRGMSSDDEICTPRSPLNDAIAQDDVADEDGLDDAAIQNPFTQTSFDAIEFDEDSQSHSFEMEGLGDAIDELATRRIFLCSIRNGPLLAMTAATATSRRQLFVERTLRLAKHAFGDGTTERDDASEDERSEDEGGGGAAPDTFGLTRFHARVVPGEPDTLAPYVGEARAREPHDTCRSLLRFFANELDAAFFHEAGIDVRELARNLPKR